MSKTVRVWPCRLQAPLQRLLFAVTTLLFAVSAYSDPPISETSLALLRGLVRSPNCQSVDIGGKTASLDEKRSFELQLSITEPQYVVFRCADPVPLFLSPGDDLRIDVEEDGSVRFGGRGAEVNTFVAEMARLRNLHGRSLLRSYLQLVELQEDAFVPAWDSAYAVLFDPLNGLLATHEIPKLPAEVERARVLYPWAEGRVRYPFRRWVSTGADFTEVSSRYDEYLSRLDLNNPSLLSLDEYKSFLGAYVHERARRALRQDPGLREGDNQWTRAKYSLARSVFTDTAVRHEMQRSILIDHIEHYGSKGLDVLLANFKQVCTDERFVTEVNHAYQKDRSYWEGHEIEVYKTVGGVSLDAHVFRPEAWRAGDRRPVFVWFHGGSWYEGAWYWSLGLCNHFVSQDFVVVQIEYRIHDRHGSTPIDSIRDAKSAIRWVRANADRLGADPGRIVAAGFSSGGHLAASCATLEEFDDLESDRSISSKPNAVALFGACVDPTLDPWFRRIVQRQTTPEDGSPSHHVRSGLPPMIAIHGTGDRMCPFSSIESFAERLKDAGNTIQVEAFEGRPHFFLWQNRDDRAEALRRTVAFLNSLGFAAKRDANR